MKWAMKDVPGVGSCLVYTDACKSFGRPADRAKFSRSDNIFYELWLCLADGHRYLKMSRREGAGTHSTEFYDLADMGDHLAMKFRDKYTHTSKSLLGATRIVTIKTTMLFSPQFSCILEF